MAGCITSTESDIAETVCPHCGQRMPLDIRVDLQHNMAFNTNGRVSLTRTEAEILEVIRRLGPVSPERISVAVGGRYRAGRYGEASSAECVYVHVHHLREKLKTLGVGINRAWHKGYALDGNSR